MRDDMSAIREPKVCKKPLKKTLEKVKKKLVSPCHLQLKEEFDATSRPEKPFKKTLEKVKKKLVSVPKV
jgi:hypothetical protein